MEKNKFITIPIKFGVSGTSTENILAENLADKVYNRLVKRMKNYKKGALVLRISSSKQYKIELDQIIYFYSIYWGIGK